MKKHLILAVVFLLQFSLLSLFAQETSPQYYYVEIYEAALLGAKSVNIDFGKETGSIAKVYKIYDENDQNLDFKNSIAAVNYMSSKGWEVVTVYERVVKAGTRTTYLLRLDASKYPNHYMIKDIKSAIEEYVK